MTHGDNFTLTGSNLAEHQRQVFERRVVAEYRNIDAKYKRSRRAQRLFRYTGMFLTLLVSSLSIYLAAEEARDVSRYVNAIIAILAGAAGSMSELAQRSGVSKKRAMYRNARDRLSRLIWGFMASDDHEAGFEDMLREFEEQYNRLSNEEMALFRQRSATLIRRLTPPARGV